MQSLSASLGDASFYVAAKQGTQSWVYDSAAGTWSAGPGVPSTMAGLGLEAPAISPTALIATGLPCSDLPTYYNSFFLDSETSGQFITQTSVFVPCPGTSWTTSVQGTVAKDDAVVASLGPVSQSGPNLSEARYAADSTSTGAGTYLAQTTHTWGGDGAFNIVSGFNPLNTTSDVYLPLTSTTPRFLISTPMYSTKDRARRF